MVRGKIIDFCSLMKGAEDEEIIYLQNRRGFIKYAITSGLDLVPVYGFGENQVGKSIFLVTKKSLTTAMTGLRAYEC